MRELVCHSKWQVMLTKCDHSLCDRMHQSQHSAASNKSNTALLPINPKTALLPINLDTELSRRCVRVQQLFRRLSQLTCSTGWQGTAFVIAEDGFVMNDPAVPTLLGDVPMASWLRTFLATHTPNLHPNAVHELTQLVGQWMEFEQRVSSEIKLWYSTIRQQSAISSCVFVMRLHPASSSCDFLSSCVFIMRFRSASWGPPPLSSSCVCMCIKNVTAERLYLVDA